MSKAMTTASVLVAGVALVSLALVSGAPVSQSFADQNYGQNDSGVPGDLKNDTGDHHGHLGSDRYKMVIFEFEHVRPAIVVLVWISLTAILKFIFHATPRMSKLCPESIVLMIGGVLIAIAGQAANIPRDYLNPLEPEVFFLYILPPIIFDAGYHMPNRDFFDNLGTILVFAVIGTIWNAASIGVSMWSAGQFGLFDCDLSLIHSFFYSSIISAVDPVAVIAVFEEIHVNELLNILVFGESLLNDGVTVVLFGVFDGFTAMIADGIKLLPIDYVAGVSAFFVVAGAGTALGILWGFIGAFVSRFSHKIAVVEPVFPFVIAYLSYLTAEMCHVSSILSLTFCGITMKNYVESNASVKSSVTINAVIKTLSIGAEGLIFLFMGLGLVQENYRWNWYFVGFTILFCLVYRIIGVFLLTSILNCFRKQKINWVDQSVMAYGGIRGAIAWGLVLKMSADVVPAKELFITGIVSEIFFSVFFQGMTIKRLVRILKVEKAKTGSPGVSQRVQTRAFDHIMSGIEGVAGVKVGHYTLREKFRHFEKRFLRPLLTRKRNRTEIRKIAELSKQNYTNNISQEFKIDDKVTTESQEQTEQNYNTIQSDEFRQQNESSNLFHIYMRNFGHRRHSSDPSIPVWKNLFSGHRQTSIIDNEGKPSGSSESVGGIENLGFNSNSNH